MRKAGLRAIPLAGGLQACLDLSFAFDLVPRSGLMEALFEAGVQEAPARLMLHWLARNTPSRLRDSILFPKLFSANMCVPCYVPYFMFDFAVCSFVNLLDTSPCSCELCN